MIRQDIRIGDYTKTNESLVSYKFIVDLYKAGVDFDEDVKKNFSLIRKYNIVNEVIYDTDIYIVERDLLSSVAYPITNNSFIGFSSDSTSFNENFDGTMNSDEIYDILYMEGVNDFRLAEVPCDKLRIYHPHNKTSLDSIIYVDTQIRDVHVHLLCRPYNTYSTNSETDFESDNLRYSEFIECWIPNIEWLLSGKAYYKEHISMIETGNYEEYVVPLSYISSNSNTEKFDDRKISSEGLSYFDNESKSPYEDNTTDKWSEENIYSYHISSDSMNDILSKGINTDNVNTQYYYEDPKLYIIEESGRTIRKYDEKYSYLICSPDNGLADDCYAALKIFSLPFRIDTLIDDDGDEMLVKRYVPEQNDDVARNYITYPIRVTISPYTSVDETTHLYINDSSLQMNSDMFQEDARMSLRSYTGFDENGIHSIISCFEFPHKSEYKTFREAYEHFYNVDLNDYTGIVEYDEDSDDDDYTEQKQCGFILCIYSDVNMTQKVAQFNYEIDNPATQLNDFAFQTTSMFDDWKQLPNILVIQCTFIDKWLGNVIKSNPIVVCEESFKYFINNSDKSVLKWNNTQTVYNNSKEMDLSKINFIDKITCTIKKSTESYNTPSTRANTKILYKPVFFRTQDLQSITLQPNLAQNIGVNLSEYMTKVETFKLSIGDIQITESARNDIYVIFNINSSMLSSNSGTYHISNQDDEYISSGKYTIV